jgi:hypothetical protein
MSTSDKIAAMLPALEEITSTMDAELSVSGGSSIADPEIALGLKNLLVVSQNARLYLLKFVEVKRWLRPDERTEFRWSWRRPEEELDDVMRGVVKQLDETLGVVERRRVG